MNGRIAWPAIVSVSLTVRRQAISRLAFCT
jgi:hypothetical protein